MAGKASSALLGRDAGLQSGGRREWLGGAPALGGAVYADGLLHLRVGAAISPGYATGCGADHGGSGHHHWLWRAASTDMPLAATFTIAMLSWYGWYESQNRAWLLAFYAFAGLGTLAKGPVAVFLAGLIVVAFAALRRDWRLVLRTLWLPGIVLYLAVVLPWFIAVQRANPEFSASSSWSTTWRDTRRTRSGTSNPSGISCRLHFSGWCRGQCSSSPRWSMPSATGAIRSKSRRARKTCGLFSRCGFCCRSCSFHSRSQSCRDTFCRRFQRGRFCWLTSCSAAKRRATSQACGWQSLMRFCALRCRLRP